MVAAAENTRRTRVYIAGPLSKGCRFDNVDKGMKAYAALIRAGYAPFLPHFSALVAWLLPDVDYDGWLDTDLPFVEACDALLRLPGESVGADREVRHAHDHNIPVHHFLDVLLASVPPRQPAGGPTRPFRGAAV